MPVSSANRQNSSRTSSTSRAWPGRLERVVQPAHRLGRLDVDRVLFADDLRRVAGDEGKVLDAPGQFAQAELDLRGEFEIEQAKAGKVADQHIARKIAVAQTLEVAESLLVSRIEILAPALVLDEQDAFPQEIDVAVLAVDLLHAAFEARHAPPRHAEHVEERVPEASCVGVLVLGMLPVARKRGGAVSDLVPGEGHRAGGAVATVADCAA